MTTDSKPLTIQQEILTELGNRVDAVAELLGYNSHYYDFSDEGSINIYWEEGHESRHTETEVFEKSFPVEYLGMPNEEILSIVAGKKAEAKRAADEEQRKREENIAQAKKREAVRSARAQLAIAGQRVNFAQEIADREYAAAKANLARLEATESGS